MNHVNVRTEQFRQGEFRKNTYLISGSFSGKGALELKKSIDDWFDYNVTECQIDLSEVSGMDIIGINVLVRLKMMAQRYNIRFSVSSPYKKEIVETFEHTKLNGPLNVVFKIENVARVA